LFWGRVFGELIIAVIRWSVTSLEVVLAYLFISCEYYIKPKHNLKDLGNFLKLTDKICC